MGRASQSVFEPRCFDAFSAVTGSARGGVALYLGFFTDGALFRSAMPLAISKIVIAV